MPAAGIKVEGAKELRAAIKRAGDSGLKQHLASANKSAAEVVVHEALPNVPVRTGRLRASVRALGSQTKANVKAGSAGVDYAAAIHWGRKVGNVWHGLKRPNPIKARPFLHDAARSATSRVVATYEAAIDRLLKEIKN